MTHTVARSAVLLTACLGLALPVCAGAAPTRTIAAIAGARTDGDGGGEGSGSGGAGVGTTTSTSMSTAPASSNPSGPASTRTAAPSSRPVTTSGGGLTLATSTSATLGHALSLSGSAPASDAGQTVAIQRDGHTGWQTVATTAIAGDGSFATSWQTSASGRLSLRAALLPPARNARAAAVSEPAATAPVAVIVYRDAVATIYGPGLWGRRTACGERLEPSTLGVASRTLRCGTRVSVAFGGRAITVAVIDRGPYANGATWDLTAATARALGDVETNTVGAAAL